MPDFGSDVKDLEQKAVGTIRPTTALDGERSEENGSERCFSKALEDMSGEPVSSCFDCRKCSNGCPVSHAVEQMPHQLMHGIRMGFRDQVLGSPMLWLCTGCQTCSVRCPNGIRISSIISALKRLARTERIQFPERATPAFYDAFLECIEKKGRVSELALFAKYNWKSGKWIENLRPRRGWEEGKLGWEMIRRKKLRFRSGRVKDKGRVQEVFRAVRERPE